MIKNKQKSKRLGWLSSDQGLYHGNMDMFPRWKRTQATKTLKHLTISAFKEARSWSLPKWLDCLEFGANSLDDSVGIYKVLSFALPEALEGLPTGFHSDISDKESGCLFWETLQSRPDPLLFRLLRRQPVLSLVLSDMGRLVTDFKGDAVGDLTLEPWFQAHCESGVTVETLRSDECQYKDFDTAVLAQGDHWKTVAKGLYGALVSWCFIKVQFNMRQCSYDVHPLNSA